MSNNEDSSAGLGKEIGEGEIGEGEIGEGEIDEGEMD
jgi:hypothetical protein